MTNLVRALQKTTDHFSKSINKKKFLSSTEGYEYRYKQWVKEQNENNRSKVREKIMQEKDPEIRHLMWDRYDNDEYYFDDIMRYKERKNRSVM